MNGDHARSATLFAALAEEQGDASLIRRALGSAINSGQMPLALQLARKLPAKSLTTDARLLLVADELRRGRTDRAAGWLASEEVEGNLAFLYPLINAWNSAGRRDLNGALAIIDQIPANSLLGPSRDEQKAIILLKFRRAADAEPFAMRAVSNAPGREARLRLAFADGMLAAGDRARALAMIQSLGSEASVARARIERGQQSGAAITNAAEAYSEFLTGLAIDVSRLNQRALPVEMAQVARYASPRNTSATILAGLFLDGQKRPDQALEVLRTVGPTDMLSSQARDVEVRILRDEKRDAEAFQVARAAIERPGAGLEDWSRYGDALQSLKRYPEAAAAYDRAASLGTAQGVGNDLWPTLLLKASALEQADRWPEARQTLERALTLAPSEPLILNFLGYSKLERGEDLDVAEAMVRKASALAPNDASITDSLGWALYKRGRLDEAITTLQAAAAKDPGQAEIHEHLGDALYKAGRQYEARFAWEAATVTAEDDVLQRSRAKLANGLTATNSAP